MTFCCKTSSSSSVQSQATAVTNSKTRQNKEQSQGRDCKTRCTAQDKNTPRLTATPPTHFKMGFFKNASKCLTLQPGRVMLTPRFVPGPTSLYPLSKAPGYPVRNLQYLHQFTAAKDFILFNRFSSAKISFLRLQNNREHAFVPQTACPHYGIPVLAQGV